MTQARAEETRSRIMSAAAEHFSTQGYNAASVDDICKDAGVSKGAFYHHFPSKQGIFLVLLQDWLKGLEPILAGARQETVPETFIRMTGMLPMVLASAQNRLPIFLEYWLQASRDRAVWQATIAPYRHYQELFAKLVEEGIAEGSVKSVNPQATAQVIVSMAVGLLLQGILDPEGADWQKVAEQSMQILMNGLAKS
jgi:AcrR family transcriptional regulator